MKYYEYKKGIHVFEAMPSEGALVAHGEGQLTKVKDINHDWFASRNQWHKIAAINCSFFNGDGTRNGSSMEDGQWQSKPYEGDPWVELIWSKGQLIIADLKLSDLATLTADFVKGVKPLIRDGIIDKSKKQVSDFAPRTAIGQRQDGMIIMMATDDRPLGLSSVATVDLMQELGCHNAAMLDGGGSSTMVINNETVNYTDNRAVTDALIFYSEKELEVINKKVVMLDAGHFLYTSGKETPRDPSLKGRLGFYIKEAEQNYPIMEKVKAILEKHDIDVRTTNDDILKDVDLDRRVAIEKNIRPDIFVSIHKNASRDFEWNGIMGTETFCYKFGGYGEILARLIHEEVMIATGDKDRKVKEGNFQIIRQTNAPAVLCELGFMTNLIEAQEMLDGEKQERYAKGIAKGILRYFQIDYIEDEPTILSDYDILLARVEGVYRDLKAFRDKL